MVRAIVGGESHATDARMVALDPARLRFGFKVDRLPTAADLAQIRALHAAGKLAMIGEVDYQYEGIRHDDPELEPLWALGEELQVPIAVHSGAGPAGIVYRGYPRHRARFGDPTAFEEFLVRHPQLKLIIMHAGFPFLDDTVALLHAYPQVHVDLDAIDWADPAPRFDALSQGAGRLRPDRPGPVRFRSDGLADAVALAVARFRAAPYLSAKQRRDIFFCNALRLSGWRDLARCGEGVSAAPSDRR